MKIYWRHHVLNLLIAGTTAAACGSPEHADSPMDDSAAPAFEDTEELRLSPATTSGSMPKGKIGTIAVGKTMSVGLVNSTGTPLKQNCILPAGSSLYSVKELGSDGSLSAIVAEPPGLKQSANTRTCRNKQTIRVRAFDPLVGLAFTASDVTLRIANAQSKQGVLTQRQTCLVLAGHSIRLNGQRTASGDFMGQFERTRPIRPTGLVLPFECRDQAAVIVSPKAIQQALNTSQETAAKPLPKPGHIVVEKTITAERADVMQIAIFPPPPAPRCVLLAGSLLIDIKSAGAGVITAAVEYAELPMQHATNLKVNHDYCKVGQTLRIKASSDFQGLAITLNQGWFTRVTRAFFLAASLDAEAPGSPVAPQALPPCQVTPNRRDLRISGIHPRSGEFLATVVAAKSLEDQMLQMDECGLNWVVFAEAKTIEKVLSREATKLD